jgi:hypothetical protein
MVLFSNLFLLLHTHMNFTEVILGLKKKSVCVVVWGAILNIKSAVLAQKRASLKLTFHRFLHQIIIMQSLVLKVN